MRTGPRVSVGEAGDPPSDPPTVPRGPGGLLTPGGDPSPVEQRAGSLDGVYRELPTTAGPGARCAWERTAEADGAPLIVPDGCVDLVWYDDGRLLLAGPDTTGRRSPVDRGTRIVGVRLAPGAARTLLDRPVCELRDHQLPLTDLDEAWQRLAETTPWGRAALEAVVRDRPRGPGDALVAHATRVLERDPSTRVGTLADDLGISTRQLNRRFDDAVGYGPKVFARVARLQRFAASGPADLATAAVEAGYASQSHLGDEVRALTSTTPVRFLEERGRRAS